MENKRQYTNPAAAIKPARILFAASEMFPLAKTGGLADVAGALPEALARAGIDVRVILPGYPQALDLLEDGQVLSCLDIPGGGRLLKGRSPGGAVPIYLYDAPALFDRAGLYQDADGGDWPDNHLRYGALCAAAVRLALGQADPTWKADIVHAHDWHTALIPAMLAAERARPATVFTIHNLAFQGNFPLAAAEDIGLSGPLLTADGLEFFGRMSFLKAGLRFSDRVTTVSPNYAREILTPEFGCGMDGILCARRDGVVGILNGVDYSVWNPATDPELVSRYTADDLEGKTRCKVSLQDELGLRRSDKPLLVFLNRLTHQKMADVLVKALPAIVANGAQVVVHGQGDRSIESALQIAASDLAGDVAVRIGYQETLAHRATAAADMALTASRFEPCGLTTMYAMRYGALPISRAVGGLADTVVDADLADPRTATGFLVDGETPEGMVDCVNRAAGWYRRRDWAHVRTSAMSRDFGWDRAARSYLEVYRNARHGVCDPARLAAA